MIKKFMGALSNPPQTISATKAATSEWQPTIEAVGSLRAVKGADLSLEVSGVVEVISFNSGDDVAEGAVLLQAAHRRRCRASCKSLQATAELSDITYKRDQKQFKMQAVSQATVDTDAANLKNATGPGRRSSRRLSTRRRCARRSPATSASAPSISASISAAGTVIVTLQALDPIFVDFFVPQQALTQVRLGQTVRCKVDTFQDKTFTGRDLGDQSEGRSASRNVQVRATLKNADHKLLPGMYATVDDRDRRAAELHHAAADRDHLQSVRRHGLRRREQGQGRRRQAATDRAPDLRHRRRRRAAIRSPCSRASRRAT